jgi:diguanylate cyclase
MTKTSQSILGRYQSDPETAEQLSQQSLKKLQQLNLNSNPVHYTLMYESLCQADPYLSEEINRLIQEKHYTNQSAESLFIGLIAQLLYKTLPADKACQLLNDLLSGLDQWIANSTQNQQQLHANIEALKAHELPEPLSLSLLGNVLPTVQTLLSDTDSLRSQISQTSEEVRLLKDELERTTTIAKTDELTNIPNRRGFNEIINTLSQEAQKHQSSFAMILLDLDHFKEVNDTFGHLIGDSVLRYIARLLHKETKGQDSIARFGGEEFAVLLPGTGYDAALRVAHNIRNKVSARPLEIKSSHQTLKLTLSAGVAMYQLGEELDQLIDRADRCLYKAKNAGRNRVCGEIEL